MKQKSTTARHIDWMLARDIGISAVATWLVMVTFLDYSPGQALLASIIAVTAFCTGIYLFIQVTWLIMERLDRILISIQRK